MKNSTPTTTTAQPTLFLLHPTVAQDDRTPAQRYRDGFSAYCGGLSIMDIYDPDEQRGWWAANSAAGEADIPGYADAMGW